jgi:hypothetical protein
MKPNYTHVTITIIAITCLQVAHGNDSIYSENEYQENIMDRQNRGINNNPPERLIFQDLNVKNHQHSIKFLNMLSKVLKNEKYNDSSKKNVLYKHIEQDLIEMFDKENKEIHFGKNFTDQTPRTVSVGLSIDGKKKIVYVNEDDHIASVSVKFCLEERLDTVQSCYNLYRELTRQVFSLENTNAKPTYLPPDERTATLILPIPIRFHPSNQRLYFDIEELPSLSSMVNNGNNCEKVKNTYCFYLDFDMEKAAWCGQAPFTKPIYTNPGISKGLHMLHLVRNNVREYSMFFEVMTPSIKIELGNIYHPSPPSEAGGTPATQEEKKVFNAAKNALVGPSDVVEMECLITIVGGFKPGVHGNICFNMDGEMHCFYNTEYMPNNSSFLHYGKNNTIKKIYIDNDLYDPTTGLAYLNAEQITIKTAVTIPLNGGIKLNPVTVDSKLKYPRKHCVFGILKSYYHDAKAIAISDELCFKSEHPFDMQSRYVDYENKEITLNVGSGIDIHAGESELMWLYDLKLHEWGIYSQNGEDGVLLSILRNLQIGHFYVDSKNIPDELKASKRPNGNRFYVEFGTEDGMECNTRILRERYHWNGLLMDGGHQNDAINLNKEFITAENINDLFRKHNVPETEFDLLIIDIDFNDFWVWKHINHAIYRPRIVIIEYNGNIPINESRVVKRDDKHIWSDSSYCGASLLALQRLGATLGYTLIYAENHGVNAFFIRTDILSNHFNINEMAPVEIEELNKLLSIEHIYRKANYFGKQWWYPDMDPEQMLKEGKEWVWVE